LRLSQCRTRSQSIDARLARTRPTFGLPSLSVGYSQPPAHPRESQGKGNMNIRETCIGADHQENSYPSGVTVLHSKRYLRRDSKFRYSKVPRCMYPCEPGSGGAADHGRLDLSGYRYTGMGPGRPGARPVVGRYTLMASSIPISLPINSGRRAPVLEGGGHSCPFVSSDGDAARECQSQSVRKANVYLG
jgi:hypothetical protein